MPKALIYFGYIINIYQLRVFSQLSVELKLLSCIGIKRVNNTFKGPLHGICLALW